jgi:tetratricopeptide (TPR) repeat protein
LHQDALATLVGAAAVLMDETMTLVAELFELDPPEGVRAGVLRMQARMFAGAEEWDKAVAAADEATRINAELRFHWATASSAEMAASILLNAERPEEALTRAQYALREAEQVSQSETELIGGRFTLGRAMLACGSALEAAELFGNVRDLEAENDTSPADRAETFVWLARAYFGGEGYGNAFACYSEAAELYQEAERNADAVAALDEGIELLKGDTDANGLLVRLLEARGNAKCQAGDSSGLDDYDAALALALKDEQAWFAADITDSKARGLASMERHEEAVSVFLTAADAYAEADDEFGAARAEFFAGQITQIELERNAAAATLMSGALERCQKLVQGTEPPSEVAVDLRNSIALKLGDVLEALGRFEEAAAVRALVS